MSKNILSKGEGFFSRIPAGSLLLLYGFSECCPAGVRKKKFLFYLIISDSSGLIKESAFPTQNSSAGSFTGLLLKNWLVFPAGFSQSFQSKINFFFFLNLDIIRRKTAKNFS